MSEFRRRLMMQDTSRDYEGYPLIIPSNRAKEVKSYTIYGNTDAEAKGVGGWDGSSFVMPIKVANNGQATLYPSMLSSPLHKIGKFVDSKKNDGWEHHELGVVDLGSLDWSISPQPAYNCSARTTLLYSDLNLDALGDSVMVAGYVSLRQEYSAWIMNQDAGGRLCVTVHGGYIGINAPFIEGLTREQLKERLSGTMLIFPLAIPSDIKGEPLPTLMLHHGDNIITTDTEVQPSNIKAKA